VEPKGEGVLVSDRREANEGSEDERQRVFRWYGKHGDASTER
jgi:hypothetical protein